MSDVGVVGLRPAFPPLLERWKWLTEPVRAERLAALRIGVAAVLLWDILFTYWPRAHDFFGRGSLGSPEVFTNRYLWWRWSFLRGIDDPGFMKIALLLWAVADAIKGWLIGG